MSVRYDFTQSVTVGVSPSAQTKVASRYDTTPRITVQGLQGQIFPFVNIIPRDTADNFVPCSYQLRGVPVPIVPAGAPIVQDGEYELFSSGFPVHLTVNLYGTQPVTVFVFPDAPVTPPYASVNLSTGLTLDAVPVNYPDDLRLQFQLASDGAMQ